MIKPNVTVFINVEIISEKVLRNVIMENKLAVQIVGLKRAIDVSEI